MKSHISLAAFPFTLSPSMRREWIEMGVSYSTFNKYKASPSMRREWIEMQSVIV